jgi:glycosyltransferase involved in cell wall biosynthesis
MTVAYVMMLFPVPSEAFAAVEVRALTRMCGVSVHTLRGPFPETHRMLHERDLADLPVHHASPFNILRGLARGLLHVGVSTGAIRWVFRQSGGNPRHLLRTLALLPRALDILFELRRERPHVVHLFWGHYPSLVGYLVKRHLPKAVLSVFLGAYDLGRRYPGSAWAARAADQVWTHAHVNVPAIEQLGVPASAVRVVHRGIDTQLFGGAPPDKVPGRIVTAGRLNDSKGMDTTIEAFARLRHHRLGASLEVLGDGPARPQLEALARRYGVGDAVTFRGHVAHAEVRDAMGRAEIFVLLSRKATERLPNVVKEAMACGCVCVTTPTPGIDELVEDGVTGYVVPLDDAATAARRMHDVLDDPARAAVMSRAARRFVLAQFDVTRSVAAYCERWAALAAARETARPVAARQPTVPLPARL